MKKILNFILLSLVLASSGLFARDVLATNSWTAAFAAAAGVDNPGQLAPSDMTHPPEYELKPSDVKKLSDADFLVYAGYEALMKTVMESFGREEEEMIKVITSYHPAVLAKTLRTIAAAAGDPAEAESYIAAYEARVEDARKSLQSAGLFGADILVHFHQKPLAEALGFNILAVFGPAPLKASQIAELGKMKPVLILDNGHNPMAAPLEELCGVNALELVNFPGGRNGEGESIPSTLEGVFDYNIERILGR